MDPRLILEDQGVAELGVVGTRVFLAKLQEDGIQVLLGHQKLDNTARYTHVATKVLHEVKGPLEYLDLKPTA